MESNTERISWHEYFKEITTITLKEVLVIDFMLAVF